MALLPGFGYKEGPGALVDVWGFVSAIFVLCSIVSFTGEFLPNVDLRNMISNLY
jgi:hypothetical protein